MKILPICFILTLALTLGTTCYVKKSFPKDVYITTKLATYAPFMALQILESYTSGKNSLNMSIPTGDLIVQAEKRCPPIGELKWKYVYSLPLQHCINLDNLPMPVDNSLHLDFQLGVKKTIYVKTFDPPVSADSIHDEFNQFHNETSHFTEKNWYYVTGYDSLDTANPTISEIWLQNQWRYSRKSCPPDDSDIPKLCSKLSPYKCPKTTYCKKDGMEIRTMSMNIVTGQAKDYKQQNCSYGAAVAQQYMNNHYYFMGNNSMKLRMKRTVPVMSKITFFNSTSSVCKKKYQMQFFVSVNPPPCPTNKNVLLEKISNMNVYVKMFYGNSPNDMEFLYKHLRKELDSKQLPYVPDQYYFAAFRGSAPILGHRVEVWILKNELQSLLLCTI